MEIGDKITLRNGRKVVITKKLLGNSFVVGYKWPEGEGVRVVSGDELRNGVFEVLLLDEDFQKSIMPTVIDGTKKGKKK